MKTETTINLHGRDFTVYRDGNVWSHPFMQGNGYIRKGFWMKFKKREDGRYVSHIRLGGKLRTVYRSRIMAQAWISNDLGDYDVDHINGDKANDSVENLRLLTRAENHQSYWSPRTRNKYSKYRGVSFDKRKKKFTAKLTQDGKSHWIGHFCSAREAAFAFDAKAIELGRNVEGLNFPDHHTSHEKRA